MTDYYGLLGLNRGATREQIIKAARRAASRLHPDKPGGDAGAMAAVNRAREVLLDPQLRAAYDVGGDEAVTKASQTGNNTIQVLKDAWNKVLDEALGRGMEVRDPIGSIKRVIGAQTLQFRANLERAQYTVKVLGKQRDRIKRMTAGRNPFEETVLERIAQCEGMVGNMKAALTACDDATKVLAEFQASGDPMASFVSGWLTCGTTSTAG